MNIESPFKVYIPSSRSRKSFVFKMKCQVSSDTTREVMISKEVKVASYKEICGGEKIRVHLGYNNDPLYMTVENNKLLQDHLKSVKGESTMISPYWEVLYKFFSLYNIEPIWHDCHFSWGHYEEEQGAWIGCMGKV